MANLNTTMDGHYSAIDTGSEFRTLQTGIENTGRNRTRRKWQDERRRWRIELTFTTQAAADAFRAVFTAGYGPAQSPPHEWTSPRDAVTYNVQFESDVLEEEWAVDEPVVYRYAFGLVEVVA